jgi:hypothetical protein
VALLLTDPLGRTHRIESPQDPILLQTLNDLKTQLEEALEENKKDCRLGQATVENSVAKEQRFR